MISTFDPEGLERRYAFLDACPDHLLDEIVTLSTGTLADRVAGVLGWRAALLEGRLPGPFEWPPEPIAAPIREALKQLGIVKFCRSQPELVDALLVDVIAGFVRQTTEYEAAIVRQIHELEQLERQRKRSRSRTHDSPPANPEELDAATHTRLRARAEQAVGTANRGMDEGLFTSWSERVRVWAEIAAIFGDLGELLGRGWDLSLGVLRHTGWHDLVRLKQLLETVPQLRSIVQSLGRLHMRDDGPSIADTILEPVRRLEQERQNVRTREIPTEMRGIERSGELSRMLPSEAAMLGHPQLRLLWHARRAERALLTYRVEGVRVEQSLVERDSEQQQPKHRLRPERGPIVAIIDTSGSMHGVPEQVAKALVLEALRTAHSEKRRCYLYAYSGPGQIVEHELSLSSAGLGSLLTFLGSSFGGGNDEIGVLRQVLLKLQDQTWAKADILFVSDGEWPAPRDLATSLERAKEAGIRFHGVQIGNRGRTGLHAVCDPVHVFSDWLAVVRG